MIFDRLEPIGDRRGDLHAGIVASTIANANRSSERDKVFSPADFMPEFAEAKPQPEQQTPEQIAERLRAFAAFQNSLQPPQEP